LILKKETLTTLFFFFSLSFFSFFSFVSYFLSFFTIIDADTEAEKREKEKAEKEKEEQQVADMKLDFWLKGHVTGADRPDDDNPALNGKDDLPMCIRKLSKRTERFELNMQRAKAMVDSGFERIELHLEAQYKVFQDIIRKAERQEKKLSPKKK
jgi:hypothetical protein